MLARQSPASCWAKPSGASGILRPVGKDAPPIRQAYRFALDVRPHQEALLVSFTGASRFFFNWGLGLVKKRLDQRAAGEEVRVPWSYHALCSEFAKVSDEVAPWRSEVVCGSQQAGLEALGQALRRFSEGRRVGKGVGFPRFRRKGACRESVIFQRPRLLDARRVEFDRRLGPIRTKERMSKLIRLLHEDERARVLRATVKYHGRTWYASFTVERSPKRRRARRPNAVVGVDVGLRRLATISTGKRFENPRPLSEALRGLRCLQRSLDRQRRAANPGNYLPDGRVRPGTKKWRKSRRMLFSERRLARLHERVANVRREHAHLLTTQLTREFGVIGAESLNVKGMLKSRRLARHITDVGWGRILCQLAYKASWSGGHFTSAGRFYPSSKTCSACGAVKAKLRLADEVFTCDRCSLVKDRDVNAARNLARLALAESQTEGLPSYLAATGAESQNARGATDPEAPNRAGRATAVNREDCRSRQPSRHREMPALVCR
jgi:putative transposase